MSEKLYFEGELYLSLEIVAEVYRVRTTWLREAYDLGLFGAGMDTGKTVCVAAVQMDRISTVVRLHEVLGIELETILLMIETSDPML